MAKSIVEKFCGFDGKPDICEFTVWEPSLFGRNPPPEAAFNHSNITTKDGIWYGRVGSRRLPSDVEALPGVGRPGHEKRREAVGAWHQQQCDAAREAVAGVLPWVSPDAMTCGGDKGIVGIVRVPQSKIGGRDG